MEKVEYYRHSIDETDIASVVDVLHSVFLTTGPVVSQFETTFAEYLNVPHAVGLMSCTAALHLALERYGIGLGDEVITTPLTYVATATAILQTGATPVFADVCSKSGLLDPDKIDAMITRRTKAIIPVHLYGRMADMKSIADIAVKNDLVLIEDAAHCIEGKRDGITPGQISEAACFSFYATKNLTCGEGGAVTCRNRTDANFYKSTRNHGISKDAHKRYHGKYQHWDMERMGWKYNMNDIQAALLVNQIKRLDEYRQKRQEIEKLYRHLLKDVPGLNLIEAPQPDERSAHHMFTVLVPNTHNRDDILRELQAKGIGCAVNYRACHNLKYFREKFGYAPADFPNADSIGKRTISLPLYPSLSEEKVRYVAEQLKQILNKLRDRNNVYKPGSTTSQH